MYVILRILKHIILVDFVTLPTYSLEQCALYYFPTLKVQHCRNTVAVCMLCHQITNNLNHSNSENRAQCFFFAKYTNQSTHCYFTILNHRKKGPVQFCYPALLGIHRTLEQKEFLKSREGFTTLFPHIVSTDSFLIWKSKGHSN